MKSNMKRLPALDLIRILSIFPIVHFHSVELVYYSDTLPIELFSWSHAVISSVSFSGFTLVFLFYFLLGWKQRKSASLNLKKLYFFAIGMVLLSSICVLAFGSDFILEWDIYHFLFFSFLVLKWIAPRLKVNTFTVAFWFFLTSLPYWYIDYSGFGAAALLGACEGEGTGMWPLLPGMPFVIFSYSLGTIAKNHLSRMSARLSLLFVSIGVLSLSFASAFYFRQTPVGEGFGCYIHQPSLVIWLALLLGLSALFIGCSGVDLNQKLLKQPFFQSLTRQAWNQHFGLCYLSHWIFLFVAYLNSAFFHAHPEVFFLVPNLTFLLTNYSVGKAVSLAYEKGYFLRPSR